MTLRLLQRFTITLLLISLPTISNAGPILTRALEIVKTEVEITTHTHTDVHKKQAWYAGKIGTILSLTMAAIGARVGMSGGVWSHAVGANLITTGVASAAATNEHDRVMALGTGATISAITALAYIGAK